MYTLIIAIVVIILLLFVLSWYHGDPKANNTFDLNAYTGKWYEKAKIPVPFQLSQDLKTPLTNVTAEYSIGDDGKLLITNCGLDPIANKTTCANATGTLTSVPGTFDVSFFPNSPSSSAKYIVLYVGNLVNGQYQKAVVGSSNKDMLWLLSRTPGSGTGDDVKFLKLIGTDNKYSSIQLDKIVPSA